METGKNEMRRIFKKNTLLTSVWKFSNYCKNPQMDEKPPENEQGGATESLL